MYHNCYKSTRILTLVPSRPTCWSCQRVSWGILGETLRSVGRLSERFVVVFMLVGDGGGGGGGRRGRWKLVLHNIFVSFDNVTKPCTPCLTKLIGQSTIYFPSLCVFQDQAMCCCSIPAGDTVTIEGITALVERFGSVAFVRLILGLKPWGWDGDENMVQTCQAWKLALSGVCDLFVICWCNSHNAALQVLEGGMLSIVIGFASNHFCVVMRRLTNTVQLFLSLHWSVVVCVVQ